MNLRNLSGDPSARILETASRLFYEQGYHATGVNQIIAEAGVAKASFYHHFHSKEELCIAYLHKRHLDWFSWLRREVERYDSAQERLLGLFAFLEEWLPNSNFRGCAFLNIASEFPSPGNEIRLLVANHKDALWDYIKQLVNKLGISAGEDDLA
jgi:AcrR family transcriptional regulator